MKSSEPGIGGRVFGLFVVMMVLLARVGPSGSGQPSSNKNPGAAVPIHFDESPAEITVSRPLHVAREEDRDCVTSGRTQFTHPTAQDLERASAPSRHYIDAGPIDR